MEHTNHEPSINNFLMLYHIYVTCEGVKVDISAILRAVTISTMSIQLHSG